MQPDHFFYKYLCRRRCCKRVAAVKGCLNPTKCAYLDNRSKITKIVSTPFECRNPSMKFMDNHPRLVLVMVMDVTTRQEIFEIACSVDKFHIVAHKRRHLCALLPNTTLHSIVNMFWFFMRVLTLLYRDIHVVTEF